MEAPQTNSLPDIQSSGDPRNIRINRVGVRGVELPVTVADEADIQHTVARLTMTVALPPDRRGTHMSRFIGILEAQTEPYTIEVVQSTIQAMLAELQAQEGTFEIRFPFFLRKAAPISRLESVMNYECAWTATISPAAFELRQETITPVTFEGNFSLRRSQSALPSDKLYCSGQSHESQRTDCTFRGCRVSASLGSAEARR